MFVVQKRASLPAFSQPNMAGQHMSLDPSCQVSQASPPLPESQLGKNIKFRRWALVFTSAYLNSQHQQIINHSCLPHAQRARHSITDPWRQEIVSGSVTMVTLEGNVVAGQLSKLQDEISKLKVDKLELLRQNVAAQREVKR